MSASELRVAVVQFSPKLGQVEANYAKARQLCSTFEPGTIDVLCFSEMILSGYVFEDSNEILPYLESSRTGTTSQMCAEISRRLRCYVLAGYPERIVSETDSEAMIPADTSNIPLGANSAVLYGPDGEWIGNYRKTNLFATDRTWAKAGSGFATFHLPAPIGTLSLGICMDLNAHPPADWRTSKGPYEFADYALAQGSDVLILLNAWLDSGVQVYRPNEPDDVKPSDEEIVEDTDWNTVNFWAARLRPLWAQVQEHSSAEKTTLVVICNRAGEEKGRIFAGSSVLFSMRRNSGMPKILGVMGRREEGTRHWSVSIRQ